MKIRFPLVRRSRRSIVAHERQKRLAQTKRFAEGRGGGRYGSASSESYKRYGREMLEGMPHRVFFGAAGRSYKINWNAFSIESNNAVEIVAGLPAQKGRVERSIAMVSVGFEKNAVIIEAMQANINAKTLLNEFRRAAKEKPLDKILQELEEISRKKGFRQVKIRRPETLDYFEKPVNRLNMTTKQTRRQMKILYQRVALHNGYAPERFFYVKRL